MKFSIKMDGFDALQKEIGDTVNRGDMSRCLERAALLVEREAKIRCPVAYGELQKSIVHRKITDLTYEVAATVHYADYIEFGTMFIKCGSPEQPLITTSGHPGHKYPSYRPFLRSSLYAKLPTIEKMFDDVLNKKEPKE